MKMTQILKDGVHLGIALLVLSVVLSVPVARGNQALAQVGGETPYGGQNIFELTCTCSANTLVSLYDYTSSSLLRLVYQPGVSRLYDNQNIYGSYLLGSYQKGAGMCRMVVGPTCVAISSDGQMGSAPGSGTSNLFNLPGQIARAFAAPDYPL